jgi:4-amino-4-deoxy-L-arabinose transferase-like glycosyltransferase
MGVAILTKGLVGIALPGLVLVVYTLVTRDLACGAACTW